MDALYVERNQKTLLLVWKEVPPGYARQAVGSLLKLHKISLLATVI